MRRSLPRHRYVYSAVFPSCFLTFESVFMWTRLHDTFKATACCFKAKKNNWAELSNNDRRCPTVQQIQLKCLLSFFSCSSRCRKPPQESRSRTEAQTSNHHHHCPWVRKHSILLLTTTEQKRRPKTAATAEVLLARRQAETRRPVLSTFHCFLTRGRNMGEREGAYRPTAHSLCKGRLASMSSSPASSVAFPPAVITTRKGWHQGRPDPGVRTPWDAILSCDSLWVWASGLWRRHNWSTVCLCLVQRNALLPERTNKTRICRCLHGPSETPTLRPRCCRADLLNWRPPGPNAVH